MDGYIVLIVIAIICYFVLTKDSQIERKHKEKENTRYHQSKGQKKYVKKSKATVMKEREKGMIEAEERRKLEKYKIEAERQKTRKKEIKAAKDDAITKQKNVIEKIDKEIVINWHKEIIKSCSDYPKKHKKFVADYEDHRRAQNELEKYKSYDFEDFFTNHESDFLEENDKLSNFYLVKIKNTIDGKLYLVTGISDSLPVEQVFIEDPVVEFIEVVNTVSLNSSLKELLLDCLLHHYKPDGTFDPFAKFNGFERVIEVRFSNKASQMIDDFKENKNDILLAMRNFEIKNWNELKEIYDNYGFNDFKDFNDHYITTVHGRDMTEYNKDFLDQIYDYYSSNCHIIKDCKLDMQSELNQIMQNYNDWKDKQIKAMEKYSNDERVGKKIGSQNRRPFTVYKKRNNIPTLADCLYFKDGHPMSINFYISGSVNPLNYPWKNEFTIPLEV